MRRNLPDHLKRLGVQNVSEHTAERGLEGIKTKEFLKKIYRDDKEYQDVSKPVIRHSRRRALIYAANKRLNHCEDLESQGKYEEAADLRKETVLLIM